MLAQVLIAEAEAFVAIFRRHVEGLEVDGWPRPRGASRSRTAARDPDGDRPLEVRRAKVRDRGEVGEEEKIRFTLDALLPILYLRSVSTGEALAALPDQGPGRSARLLRLPCRALGPPAHFEPDRERVRNRASSHRTDERSTVGEDRQAHGVQARQCRRENMAATEGGNQLPKIVQGAGAHSTSATREVRF